MAIDKEIQFAAGLLEASGDLTADVTIERATAALRRALSPGCVWSAGRLSDVDAKRRPLERVGMVPHWRKPSAQTLQQCAGIVDRAWRDSFTRARSGSPLALRVQVRDPKDIDEIRRVGDTIDSCRVVPMISRDVGVFRWRWPLRVGVGAGPRASAWVSELRQRALWFDDLVEVVEIADPSAPGFEPYDIFLVDADSTPAIPWSSGTCVFLLGSPPALARHVEAARFQLPAPIVVMARVTNARWLVDVICELSHNQPIDVAVKIAEKDAVVFALAAYASLTAIREWALEVVARRTKDGRDVMRDFDWLRQVALRTSFAHESDGATDIVKTSGELERTTRAPTTLVDSPPMAGPPDAVDDEIHVAAVGDAPAQPASRRLNATTYADDKQRTQCLKPLTKHQLIVSIELPGKRGTAADKDFPMAALPEGTNVDLDVYASSDTLKLNERRTIQLSTTNVTKASSSALFEFVAPADQEAVRIELRVEFGHEAIQLAHYLAVARDVPLEEDAIQVEVVRVSNHGVPRAKGTGPQATYYVHGANLETNDRQDAVSLANVTKIVDAIEKIASSALTALLPPTSLADEAARKLVVDLARIGGQFREILKPLHVPEKGDLLLVVDSTSDVYPLELVYEGPIPRKDAKLCSHATNKAHGEDVLCDEMSEYVACPFGFWGQWRVITRKIPLRDEDAPKGNARPELTLRTILYAATARADSKAAAKSKPSDALERELTALVAGGHFRRVAKWVDWTKAIEVHSPDLLVILGHTDTAKGDTVLHIGDDGVDSGVPSADVRTRFIRGERAPSPLVLLLACDTAVPRNPFGGISGAFTSRGAAAVLATLTKVKGREGARSAALFAQSLRELATKEGKTLAEIMTHARRRVVAAGNLSGLLLVSHGDVDVVLRN